MSAVAILPETATVPDPRFNPNYVYVVEEVARRWRLRSQEKVSAVFIPEIGNGVMDLGWRKSRGRKRQYHILRISAEALIRVEKRLGMGSAA